MLDFLRRAVRSWVAKALLGLLVVSFAVWGIGDVAGGLSTRVATVGDRTVEVNAFARALRLEQQRYGLDQTQMAAAGLDRMVLARLVREAAFIDTAQRLGLSAPDEAVARQVRSDPSFQVAGRFDPAQYQAAVSRLFPSVTEYETMVRETLSATAVAAAAQSGAQASRPLVEALRRHRDERRAFDVLALSAEAAEVDVPEPDEATLAAHLEAEAARFRTPETRAVTWLEIDPAALAGEIAEAYLRAAYEAAGDAYVTPETRRVSQLVLPDAAAAEAALARLAAGEADFDALLAERDLSAADADLGWVTRDVLPGARGEAAFAAAEGDVAGPAEALAGVALLRVDAVRPEIRTSFEEAAPALRAMLAGERGRPAADALAESVEDLRAAGEPLEGVAAELEGVALRSAPALTRDGLAGSLDDAALAREAFIGRTGEELDLIRTPEGGYLIPRVDAVAAPALPALDAVRDAVAEDWRAARVAEALAMRAEALAERARAGETLAALAAEIGGAVASVGPLRRADPDPRLSVDAREALFAAAPGAVAVSTAAATAAVAVLTAVEAPPESGGAELAQAVAASAAQDQLEYLGRALERAASVSLNQNAVDAVLSQFGGVGHGGM